MAIREKIYVGVLVVSVLGMVYWRFPAGPEVPVAIRVGKPTGGRVQKTTAEWRAELPAEAYRITREKGTERAFTGTLLHTDASGDYLCLGCGQPLFNSAAKFDSGTGWPSFDRPVNQDAVSLFEDRGSFSTATEVVCSRCDAHLGHVFDDGPTSTKQRYCMNSAALRFTPKAMPAAQP